MAVWLVVLLTACASGTCHETEDGYVPVGTAPADDGTCPVDSGDPVCAYPCDPTRAWCAGTDGATTCERVADLQAWVDAHAGTGAYLSVGTTCSLSCGAL